MYFSFLSVSKYLQLCFDFYFNFSKSELQVLLAFNGAIASFFFFFYMKIEILLMMRKGKYIMDKSLLKEARVLFNPRNEINNS